MKTLAEFDALWSVRFPGEVVELVVTLSKRARVILVGSSVGVGHSFTSSELPAGTVIKLVAVYTSLQVKTYGFALGVPFYEPFTGHHYITADELTYTMQSP